MKLHQYWRQRILDDGIYELAVDARDHDNDARSVIALFADAVSVQVAMIDWPDKLIFQHLQ